jgi:hypothetical protein
MPRPPATYDESLRMVQGCLTEHMTPDERARFVACEFEHDLGVTCPSCGLTLPSQTELDSRMARLTGLPRVFGA